MIKYYKFGLLYLGTVHTYETYCKQHICSPVHTKEIYFTQFVVIFPFESTKNMTTMSAVAHHFLTSHNKFHEICFLFHSVRNSIEIYWFVASCKYFIFCATCFKQFVSPVCAAPYYKHSLDSCFSFNTSFNIENRQRSYKIFFIAFSE